ncbi:EutP/PduV family microcompartment system protein [Carboxydothermus ferrireducens]|uniref:Ethanolamine utilization protein EutP n=1 Tax=Carboxydothermus ferrireducens DSM 11255 TaxID=1119529 RepID=A0ABX2RC35_9THEO|nr:EutP/PduV family microcompartment system protein [Carboxydothermus ferrireducens]NYE58490.1 ethanolamine utilization protein EutP [Carboxydothermus ferrireducens DSM 11255]
MKKRLMVIGAIGCGKTTLILAIKGLKKSATKTQAVEFIDSVIDTPGEFLENPFYYKALMATAFEAEMIFLLQDATRKNSVFPPGFAKGFPKKTFGIVTKIDHPEANLERAVNFLRLAGVNEPIFFVSALRGDGINELINFINESGREKQ